MLPTTQEYKISLMIGQDSFRTLEGVEVIPNPNYPDEPWYSTGGLAIVFKLKLKDKLYALKCFYTEANERQERLGLIAAYLKQNPSPYFVDFTYLENELWVQTNNSEGQGYPVVLMEWVEGKTLDNYLEQICTQNNTPALKNLYFQFCNLAWWLQQQPIAHGDIKHDNLIVTPDGKLKLIDYDGVFVPALRGRKANEMGSPCYQHPKRDAYFFDKNLDDFSLLVLQITLLALQQQPKLFTEHYNGDGIILKDTDYQNFTQSPIKTILWQLPEVKIPLLLSQLQGNLNNLNAIDLMPLLQDVAWINWLVDGRKDSKLEFERQRLLQIIKNEKNIEVYPFLISNGLKSFDKIIRTKNEKFYVNFSTIDREYILHIFKKYHSYISKDSVISKNFDRWKMRDMHDINSFEITFKWDENWGMLFSEKISKFYQIPDALIEKFRDKLDWESLSGNESLPWSLELIEKFKDKLDWESLSRNESLPWSIELIEKYINKWCWNGLSRNESLPWSLELIEKYEDKWDWRHLGHNNSNPWSCNNSLPLSTELIEKYEDKWDWTYLGLNNSLLLSIELIEKYEDKWDWKSLSYSKSLLWSVELVEKFKDKLDWESLSRNESIPWSIELIEKYKEKWDWDWLGMNQSLPWSEDLTEIYIDFWSWHILLNDEYQHIPWSLSLLTMQKDNPKIMVGISQSHKLPWSVELIEKYKDNWNWNGLSRNESLPWSLELIEKFKNKWDWQALCWNNSLGWSLELFEKFTGKIFQKTLTVREYMVQNGLSSVISKVRMNEDGHLYITFLNSNNIDTNIFFSNRAEALVKKDQFISKGFFEPLLICYTTNNENEEIIKLISQDDNFSWNGLSSNTGLIWTTELIGKYEDRWDWKSLSENFQLPWSIELIENYKAKWDWFKLQQNIAIYEKVFQPILNDEFIDEVIAEISGTS